ncbi:hypothetical protein C8R47DRAFT_1081348 [Mycena vitilis]|nr:hypothetical protein C8R47DRAFT_1081348 [Mycena vitilis]
MESIFPDRFAKGFNEVIIFVHPGSGQVHYLDLALRGMEGAMRVMEGTVRVAEGTVRVTEGTVRESALLEEDIAFLRGPMGDPAKAQPPPLTSPQCPATPAFSPGPVFTTSFRVRAVQSASTGT